MKSTKSISNSNYLPLVKVAMPPRKKLLPNLEKVLYSGMIAEGEIVFVDSFGLEQRVPVTLTAQSSFNGDSPLSWLVQPSNAIMVIFVLLAISLMPTSNPKPINQNQPTNEDDESQLL